ncbi:peptidylprolyl isomerase [Nodosilinea sp. AN01ver1]|uniref:peptidylprolyl isomerase n=1 Tax=Nodosilinea sp. AN01ver1 TaxID=3423362 RepID=UPI003D31F97C
MALSMRPFTLALAAVLTLWLGACASSGNLDTTAGEAPANPGVTEEVAAAPTGLPVLDGTATVEMVVNGSPIVMELDGTNAPITAGNFVDLVNRGVYDGLVFHRVVRDPEPFVVQGGDPQSKDPSVPAQQLGTGSFVDPDTQAPRYVPLEIKPAGAEEPIYSETLEEAGISDPPELPHTRGAVAMARSQAVDSASAQFYITLAELPFLDGSYAVFGYVTSGMETVDAIQQGDRIESARVVEGLENLKTE